MDQFYEGFYARFDTVSKADGSMLMGPDHLVGDTYDVFFKTEDGQVTAWLRNRFGAETGYFDANTTRKLQIANARDQSIRAVLALVAYSETSEASPYWGQMALFCFNPRYSSEIGAFIDRVAASLAEGVRPKIDLGSQAAQKILDEPGWFPSDTLPIPHKEKGMAVLKSRRSISEKMIEQGRARNIGCYVVSWAFIVVVVLAVVAFVLYLVGAI